jgi:hypothetical protein
MSVCSHDKINPHDENLLLNVSQLNIRTTIFVRNIFYLWSLLFYKFLARLYINKNDYSITTEILYFTLTLLTVYAGNGNSLSLIPKND